MAKHSKTLDIAREMAHMPIHVDAVAPALTHHTIADAMAAVTNPETMTPEQRDEAVQSSIDAIERVETDEPINAIAAIFDAPSFELGERKMYPDKDNPLKASGRLARIILAFATNSNVTLKASVYLYTEQLADKRTRKETRVSLPQAIEINTDDAATVKALDDFRDSLLEGYEAWAARVNAGQPTAMQTSTPRGRRISIE